MKNYHQMVLTEINNWKKSILKKPSIFEGMAKGVQKRVNRMIPDQVHHAITGAIKNMVQAVLFGSEYIGKKIIFDKASLQERDAQVLIKRDFYKKTAALSGAGTGAGGLWLGLADFPILLSLKMKFLFDTAGIYGFDVSDFKERLYLLYIFQLAFSSQSKRREVFRVIANWQAYQQTLPMTLEDFDWQSFQQEYRDYIDLAKMAQLLPGIGALVGAYANYHLMDKLAETAMNCYRLRHISTLSIK